MSNNIAAISSLAVAVGAACLLGACTTVPIGPSVMVLPGSGKNFDQFRADDAECRQFAFNQIGGPNASAAAVNSGVSSAAVGTLLGAAAGAAIDGGHGAGIGAGTGLLMGGMTGADAANASSYGVQRRYDFSYEQCMYAKGNRVPVAGSMAALPHGERPLQRRPDDVPLPPPGNPPPPPPDAAHSR
jgi:hypothetical protein